MLALAPNAQVPRRDGLWGFLTSPPPALLPLERGVARAAGVRSLTSATQHTGDISAYIRTVSVGHLARKGTMGYGIPLQTIYIHLYEPASQSLRQQHHC